MSKETRQASSSKAFKLAELDDGNTEAPEFIQILRTGEFDHPFGAFSLGRKDLANMVKNFNEKVIPNDLALDFSHDAGGKAAGWFTSLELKYPEGDIDKKEPPELWAGIKWSASGRASVEGGDFRYTSSDIHFDYRGNESDRRFGITLLGAALTNRPFIKGMDAATQLSEKEKIEMNKELDELKGQMKLLNTNAADQKKLSDAQAEDIRKLTEAATSKDAKIKELSDAKVLAEKTAIFDKMFSDGKAVEAQREHYMSGDMVKFAENAAAINSAGKGGQNKDGKGGDGDEDVQDKVISLAEKRMEKDKELSLGDAQTQILNENPKLAEKYDAL